MKVATGIQTMHGTRKIRKRKAVNKLCIQGLQGQTVARYCRIFIEH